VMIGLVGVARYFQRTYFGNRLDRAVAESLGTK
jgi:hypothetical protein